MCDFRTASAHCRGKLQVLIKSTEIIIRYPGDMQLISSQTSPIPVTTKTPFWQMVQLNQRLQPPMA